MKKILIFLFLSLMATSDCYSWTYPNKTTAIVWVHGTIPPLVPRSIFKNDRPYKSKYMRYFPYQPIDRKGLVHTDESKKTLLSLYSKLYRKVAKSFKLHKHESLEFYTFGWPGTLNDNTRKKWGDKLYKALIEKKFNRIICITHSHGANVVLNLAKSEDKFNQNLKIDSLIMYAPPVQVETRKCINSKIFNKMHNFYSRGDSLQVLDMFSTYDFFSKRSFKGNQTKYPPRHLTELQVTVNGQRPAHCEFWLMGNSPMQFYRDGFPLYPVPMCVFSSMFSENVALPSNNLTLCVKTRNEDLDLFFEDKGSKKLTKYVYKNFNEIRDIINNWSALT